MSSFSGAGYGNGGGYGNGDGSRTRNFLSQQGAFSTSHDIYGETPYCYAGGSSYSAPRVDMAALDLNSTEEEWPSMVEYAGILRSGSQGVPIGGSGVHTPPRSRSINRTLGIHTARTGAGRTAAGRGGAGRSGRGRGATAAHPSASSGSRAAPLLLAASSGVRNSRGSRSRSGGGRPSFSTAPLAEDNFNMNFDNDDEDDDIQEMSQDRGKV
ncbi:hypothetical protein C2845_PM01G05130 [Panicum miliaceum]|uniref:Uncharacterized protein n=1 Tax=Panicum miliaceum TaxID=4540 RepID=A0A3L6TNK0_PANMI|nr:hypothetical protein C2845_PM01G05130 [Panicum miliaceum]